MLEIHFPGLQAFDKVDRFLVTLGTATVWTSAQLPNAVLVELSAPLQLGKVNYYLVWHYDGELYGESSLYPMNIMHPDYLPMHHLWSVYGEDGIINDILHRAYQLVDSPRVPPSVADLVAQQFGVAS